MIYKIFGVVCIIVGLIVGFYCVQTVTSLVYTLATSPSIDSYLIGKMTFSLIVALLSGFVAYFLFKFGKKMFKV